MVFKENESYMHKKAKEVVKEWFDSSQNEKGYVSYSGFSFYPNRNSGVWLEYPLYDTFTIWDEYFDSDDPRSEYVPTYEECKQQGMRPKAVLDIACVHKGEICLGIEIYHKHRVSDKKIH